MIIDISENVLYVYSFFSFYGATYFFYNIIQVLDHFINQKKNTILDPDSDSDSDISLKREFKLRKRKRKNI